MTWCGRGGWQEMQRIGPDITRIFEDWETDERARAAHYHMLAALSMRPMGNYDYAFIQREVLRRFPLAQVQHLFCVLCNGSGCAVQVLQTPCLSPHDVLEVVTELRHDKLWQRRLPNWKRLGVDGKPAFGPLFKVSLTSILTAFPHTAIHHTTISHTTIHHTTIPHTTIHHTAIPHTTIHHTAISHTTLECHTRAQKSS